MFFLLHALLGCTMLTDLNPFGGPPGLEEDNGWGPPDTGTEGVHEAPGAGFPFAEGRIFEIAIDLPPASVDGLERNGEYMPGTVRFAGFAAEAGVRLKGASTFDNLDGKPSLKVSFSEYTPGATFLGVERLTLNAMKFDPTMLREATAYHLFAELEVPAPRHGYAQLTINGQPYGLYSIIETLDENFLDRAFEADGDGNLYDSTFVYADLTSAGIGSYDLQEGDPATAGADLAALVQELDNGDILDVLDRRFDGPATLRYLAVDLVTANWDGYSRNTNNYLLYHATVADRWYFVPWGQDTAFRGGGQLYAGVRGRLTAACQGHGECRALLDQACRDVLATWEDSDLHGWASAMTGVIGPACAADPRKREDCDHEDILETLLSRPEDVRRELGE